MENLPLGSVDGREICLVTIVKEKNEKTNKRGGDKRAVDGK